LYCCANACRRKNDFCDAQTHARPRAAGVSPPWLGEPSAVLPESNIVQRLANTQPRAAGVSPQWRSGNALAKALPLFHGGPPTVRVPIAVAFALSGPARDRVLCQRRLCVIFSRCARVQGCHGGLTLPALVLVYERLPAKNDFCDAQTHVRLRSGGREPAVARSYDRCAVRSECCSATSEHTTKSGGRQPAVVFGKRACRNADLKSRETAVGVPTNAGAVASSGAAKGRHLYQRRLSVIFSRCPRVQGCHGGLTPPALVA
jgi:hypothetical protein